MADRRKKLMKHLSLVQQGLSLTLEKVSKQFGDREILKSLNLSIQKGQFVAIVGRSGCGKSTLLRLLAGLESVSAGSLSADGVPLAASESEVRMMFQDARLLPWKKVIDNVGLGLNGSWKSEALAVLEAVGLADRANDWPSALSGGQKQRVALARALIHRPRLLLLDEPFGALDALTRLEMQQLLTQLWQQYGFTVILVTHDVHEAVLIADRILLIEQGEIGMDLAIPLGRPRTMMMPKLSALEAQVLEAIMTPVEQGKHNNNSDRPHVGKTDDYESAAR
ncbi:Aliphatic sulfonates import ATP-binding protein SsuB [Xenorhabdus innexi]|uniref:Aliphatic sulfonates import ATP-binding protein SsuB n=2 Tax=Xenorhabdus innexi TaxID=290109 RepID=A0A1N6MTZ9_9GAMM|nr:Aliphatic sulfonates import ATP-binding protein SsuB [Xenorhabdus innexi]